jgi:hypothetical protein
MQAWFIEGGVSLTEVDSKTRGWTIAIEIEIEIEIEIDG